MILDDLADRLTTQGVVTSGEIYRGALPPSPDELIALFQTGGPAPIHTMNAGPGTAILERPHVQVIARALRADAASKRAQDVYHALDALGPVTLNGVRYHAIWALGTPSFLRRDETGRVEYVVNFEVMRDLATSS